MDTTPRWITDLKRLLPIRSQFVVAGNIRDSFLTPYEKGTTLAPLLRCLWVHLSRLDYRFLLVFDPVDGLRPYPNEPAIVEQATRLFDLKLADGVMPMSLENLIGIMKRVAGQREARCALVVDFASRLTRQPDHLDANEHRFFVAAERISLHSHPIVPKGADISTDNGKARFNPVLWLVNRGQDLPSWLALDSTRVSVLTLGLPEYETRLEAARHLGNLFAGYQTGDDAARTKFAQEFAQRTDGLPLVALADIAQLADRQDIGFRDVDDAVQCYKVGATENPWKKDYLRERIANALPFIEERVRGQRPAVTKAIDILMRSVMGLTGAQARASGNRPRGVLFFAGPTGVGKTELAKTLTQLIFGDDRAYIRFDMSEFAEEHTGARLLGAPPGYIGYDAGGELTNAVREKPFAVVLFDEIEKAHPRILDKFLQILEDGRLTDGRGETAYFSEAILVFTSNLGIFVEDEHGKRVQSVQPGDPHEVVESRVRGAIQDYFKFRLSRPEILNRIGDNIIVFGFITPEIGAQIFDGMLRNVVNRVRDEHKVDLDVAAAVRDQLRELCTRDLSNGGRGIGNQLESVFVNPLARAMFRFPLEGRKSLVVTGLTEDENRIMTVTLSLSPTVTVQLNKAHWPVTVLGPGRRIGLWLQGCSIHCPGCVSQDTWPQDANKTIAVRDLLAWCKRVAVDGLDGVTISGGEPFEQPAGLRALLEGLRVWRRADNLDFDLLCYSGLPLRTLQRKHAAVLALLDAVIPEPYVNDLPQHHVWRGSSNQPLVPLSDRGRARYTEHVEATTAERGKRMQAAVEGGRVWMIGIPGRGDMAAVEALCASRGLALTKVSWRR